MPHNSIMFEDHVPFCSDIMAHFPISASCGLVTYTFDMKSVRRLYQLTTSILANHSHI